MTPSDRSRPTAATPSKALAQPPRKEKAALALQCGPHGLTAQTDLRYF
jgi:hypothetical protein